MIALAAAPLLMLLLGAVERRSGPALAGLLGAAPLTIALVVVGTDPAAGAEIAAHAGAHVVAQVPFFVAFAAVVTRRGALAGVVAGAAAFALVSLPVASAGVGLATAAAIPALLAASAAGRRRRAVAGPPSGSRASTFTTARCETRRSHGARPNAHAAAGRVHPAVSAAVAFALVGATLAAAALAGPAAAGTVAAFPALSTTLALVVARNRGRAAAATALHGALRGLRGYLAFCVGAAALGAGAGLAACALVFLAGRGDVFRVRA